MVGLGNERSETSVAACAPDSFGYPAEVMARPSTVSSNATLPQPGRFALRPASLPRCLAIASLAVPALLALTTSAHAIEFKIEAQTVGDAYQLVTSDNAILNRNRLHQYLGLSAFDTNEDGQTHWSFTSLLRFDADFGLTQAEQDRITGAGVDTAQLSLQYAWLDGRELLGGLLDLRLGRQMLADGLDYLMFDGATVTINTPAHFAVELMAGSEVKNEMSGLNASQLQLDGTRFMESTETSIDKPTIAFGAALETRDLGTGRYRLGYRRYWSDGAVDAEKVGGSFQQKIGSAVNLTGILSYDLFNAQFDRIQAGGRVRVADHTEIDLEYVRTVPSFEGDSIFNFFSTYPMNDLNLRWRLYPGDNDRIYAGGKVGLAGNEGYKGDVLYGDVDTMVVGWGAMAGWSHFFGQKGIDGRLMVDVSFDGGYAGDRFLADVGGVWAVVPGEWELEGRVTTTAFDDAIQGELHATSFGYQLGGRYLIDKKAAFAVVAEHNLNRIETSQFRVFALIDLNLWL
jgi:hypothetical protein